MLEGYSGNLCLGSTLWAFTYVLVPVKLALDLISSAQPLQSDMLRSRSLSRPSNLCDRVRFFVYIFYIPNLECFSRSRQTG